jgi:hypothetical protein
MIFDMILIASKAIATLLQKNLLVKRLKKILLSLFIVITVLCLVGYFYLFIDTEPYPAYSADGLTTFSSASIPIATSELLTDSLSKNIHVDGEWFKDHSGRVMHLRGINVAGSTKLPFSPRIESHVNENFFESAKTVSFIGRPFPLEEADDHFKRLKLWGFQFIRLLVTWEAIEHEGPGIYDQAYLEYLHEIVKKAASYNINVFIDPHQDVWSRFTGGDGAPLWTLDKTGFNPTQFTETGAAIVHNIYGDPFPKMIWPTNYSKLGAATMFTLFFGGKDFAPDMVIDGVNIQEYLQDHYINAVRQVAIKLKDLPNVIGFDTLNESSAGYIGLSNLDTLGLLRLGAMPTYFQGMAAGDGNSVDVSVWEFDYGFKEVKKEQLNPSHAKAWKEGATDIWQHQGVWGYDYSEKPVVLKQNYFSQSHGRAVDFSNDYWKPFALRYAKALHDIDAHWIIFAEPALFTKLPKLSQEEATNFANAGHWYDGVTLVTKEFMSWVNADVETTKPILGKKHIREYFNRHMAKLKSETKDALGEHPTLIGEFGIPFDLDKKEAYSSGDFLAQENAIDRSFNAMEANMLNYTLWNYSPDNTNAHGDQWNGEDLSIFSVSQQKDKADINSGGRALNAVIRPYPYKVSGTPIEFFFNKEKCEFVLKFKNDPSLKSPTEIFIPPYHYANGFDVLVSNGKVNYDSTQHFLLYFPVGAGDHMMIIRKQPAH